MKKLVYPEDLDVMSVEEAVRKVIESGKGKLYILGNEYYREKEVKFRIKRVDANDLNQVIDREDDNVLYLNVNNLEEAFDLVYCFMDDLYEFFYKEE